MRSSAESHQIIGRELGEALVQAGKVNAGDLDRAFRLPSTVPEGLIELLPRLDVISRTRS